MTGRSDKADSLAEALVQAGQELSVSTDVVPGAGDEELDSGSIGLLVDEALGDGRRVARIGDCSLMVSSDGLSAFLRGPLPAYTTDSDVMHVVEEAGIRFGVIPGRIHDALPRRRRRNRREKRVAEPGLRDTEIARGQTPAPSRDAHIEYFFELVEEAEAAKLRQLLQASPIASPQKTPLLRCTPSDVAGCRQAVIACDGSVGRSVPSAPYVWNIGMG